MGSYSIECSFLMLCFNLAGWSGSPERKGSQEALIITWPLVRDDYFVSFCLVHQHKCFWLKREKLIWSSGTSLSLSRGFHPLSSSYANPVYLTNSGISCVSMRAGTAEIRHASDFDTRSNSISCGKDFDNITVTVSRMRGTLRRVSLKSKLHFHSYTLLHW